MIFDAGREQWKVDLKIVHEKEQLLQRLTNQDAISGIQNRQALDEHVGSLIHAPGIVSQQPPGRSMNISNISARVISHSGHVIAEPRRETEIFPQAQSEPTEQPVPQQLLHLKWLLPMASVYNPTLL